MSGRPGEAVPFAPRALARVNALLSGLDRDRMPGGYRLESIDLDQAIGLVLRGPEGTMYVELDLAPGEGYARSRHLRITYQRPGADGPLSEGARQALDTLVGVIRRNDTDPLPEADGGPEPGPAMRQVRVDRVLGTSPNALTDYHINPYVGCTVGCVYCNARFRAEDVRRLDGRGGRPWGRWLDAKVNAPEILAAEVGRHRPGSVCFSPVVTDPYVASERRYRITRGCLEVLCDAGYSAVVLTRTAGVLDDLELLGEMAGAAVGVSIPSDDDEVLRRLEPGGLPWAKRLDVLVEARRAGLATFAVVQPAFPRALATFVEALAPQVDAVHVDTLYEVERVGHHFEDVRLSDVGEVERAFSAVGVATDLRALLSHPAGRDAPRPGG